MFSENIMTLFSTGFTWHLIVYIVILAIIPISVNAVANVVAQLKPPQVMRRPPKKPPTRTDDEDEPEEDTEETEEEEDESLLGIEQGKDVVSRYWLVGIGLIQMTLTFVFISLAYYILTKNEILLGETNALYVFVPLILFYIVYLFVLGLFNYMSYLVGSEYTRILFGLSRKEMETSELSKERFYILLHSSAFFPLAIIAVYLFIFFYTYKKHRVLGDFSLSSFGKKMK